MKTSLVLGRTGSFNEETGLFVLNGGIEDFGLELKTIQAIGKSRDGFEISSTVPFADHKLKTSENVLFTNQCEGWTKDRARFLAYIQEAIEAVNPAGGGRTGERLQALDVAFNPLFFQWNKEKIADRRYVEEWFGLLRPQDVLKVILKQQGVATKRTMLFATGIPPEDGGRMWLVSPHGFPWWGEQSNVVVDTGALIDIEQATMVDKFLFLLVTNAVPLISGHRKLQQDENNPRILCYDKFDSASYSKKLDNFLVRVVTKLAELADGTKMLAGLYNDALGSVPVKPRDFGVDHAVAMPDTDEMW